MPNRTLAPKKLIFSSRTLEKTPQDRGPRIGSFQPVFRTIGFWPWETIPATTLVHAPAKEEEQGEATLLAKFQFQPPSNAPGSGRRMRRQPPRWVAGFLRFPVIPGQPIPPSPIFGPFELIHVVFFADSSPFERYDERKFGRRLDHVFWPPQQPLDQGKGTVVFLVSWAFR